MKTVNWGIVGCGNVCERKSGPAMYKTPHSALAAVMRRDAEKVADFARRHNVPLSIISAGLGHSSERTTLIYLDSVENVALDNANHEILKCL